METSSYKGILEIQQVILVGDSKVGKTSFFIRVIKNIAPRMSQSTVGVEYATKQIAIKDQLITLKIWDTAGSEKYKSLTSKYIQFILVISDNLKEPSYSTIYVIYTLMTVYNRGSKVSLQTLDIYNYADDRIVIILVGNKLDLIHEGLEQRCIAKEKVQQFCKGKNLLYCEISTKTGEGITELMDLLVSNLQARKIAQGVQQQRPRQNCCS